MQTSSRTQRYRLTAAASVLLISGCQVGPKYVKPDTPAPPSYKETSPQAYSNAPDGTWKPANPSDAMLKGKWWEVYHEPELNALEEQLDINNQTIAQYFQNFMAARAQVREARSQYYPTIGVDPAYTRQHTGSAVSGVVVNTGGTGTGTSNTAAGGRTISDFGIPFDVSWEPDFFGRVRSEVHEYQYAAQVSAATLENERLIEQADLAEFYFELRGQDELQALYNKAVELDRQTLELTKSLVETGIESPYQIAEAENTLHLAEENAAGIATNRAIYEHAIATLIGRPAPTFTMPIKELTTPPPQIPTGLPSQLLQRRPDVAAAERTMAEANALIGFERAAYFPTVSLSGTGGVESATIGQLFSSSALLWSLGASVSETIFDAGLRRATVAQYTAQYNGDVAAYKQTVLVAFQQVEDYLATMRATSTQIVRQQQAIEAAQRYVDAEVARYQTGVDPYLDVLTAQSDLLGNQQTLVQLRVAEMTASVELIQALGGGWDTSNLPAAATITSNAAAEQVGKTP